MVQHFLLNANLGDFYERTKAHRQPTALPVHRRL